MEKVKVGVIGVGNMGGAHVFSLGKIENAQVTALCDLNPEKLKPFQNHGARLFDSDEAFFEQSDVDAVVVATPHYHHVELVLKALERGKHALTEKPVSVHKKMALPLLEAAKKYPDLRLAAMFNQRTIEAHKKIKQLIDSGELGKILRINWIITDWFRTQCYYDSGDWRATWRGEGGGVLLNQCPHQLDLMQWFFGMPRKVTAVAAIGKYHNIEVEDDVTALLEYPDGTTGVFITSTGEAPGTNRLEIAGDRGRLIYEDGKIHFCRTECPVGKYRENSGERFLPPPIWKIDIPADSSMIGQHQKILQNFCDSIQTGIPLIAPAVEGLRGLEIGNAMLLSGLAHRTVELPLDENEFAGMIERLAERSSYRKENVRTLAGDDFSRSFSK